MRKLSCLFVFLISTAPAHAAVLFEGTFGGVVTDWTFGPDFYIHAHDSIGDPIPGFRPEGLTGAELGLSGWLRDFDPGASFVGSVSLEDQGGGSYALGCTFTALSGATWSPCGFLATDVSLAHDPVTSLVSSFSATFGDGVSYGGTIGLSGSGGGVSYEDDGWYRGALAGGGYWESMWGVSLSLSLGPVTRTDITSVPLPATALLLAGGVGLLGAAARRGRQA